MAPAGHSSESAGTSASDAGPEKPIADGFSGAREARLLVEVGQIFLRLAVPADVPQIRALIEGLARFEKLEHECVATDEKLRSTLFGEEPALPPFKGPSVVILEVGNGPEAQAPGDAGAGAAPGGEAEQVLQVKAKEGSALTVTGGAAQVDDMERLQFVSTCNPHRTIAAFALTFPNYSTFLAAPGLYLEDLYVREPYRRCGLGTILLRYLARVAHKRKMGRLDWSVLDWNEKAIQFYTQRIGAKLMGEWRICRLEGSTLEAAAKTDLI